MKRRHTKNNKNNALLTRLDDTVSGELFINLTGFKIKYIFYLFDSENHPI